MFIVVVMTLGLSLGIPTAISLVVFPERRPVIRSALIAAGGTTALFAILTVFFNRAYFQNPTSPIGLAIIVTFLVTFVLAVRRS